MKKQIIEDIRKIESLVSEKIDELNKLEDEEMILEPEHRKMISGLMNSDLIARLPNQTQRDSTLEDYVLNHEDYRELHEKWLITKSKIKRTYRKYIFYSECLKNRRTELQALAFGGE